MIKVTVDKPPIRIAIEGIDGSGKSTQVVCVSQSLISKGYSVAVFRYTASRQDIPGRLIRKLYKTKYLRRDIREQVSKNRILQELLFAWQASHNLRDHCREQPCDLILCDRCAITAYAAHIINPAKPSYWEVLLPLIESRFVPEYAIYLQIPVHIAVSRLSSRVGYSNDENIEKLHQIKNNYDALVSKEWEPRGLKSVKKWLSVNGDQDKEVVHLLIEDYIEKILMEECTVFHSSAQEYP